MALDDPTVQAWDGLSATDRRIYDTFLRITGLANDALSLYNSIVSGQQSNPAGGQTGVTVPAPAAAYIAAVGAHSPALYLPMQDENGRTIKDTAGTAYPVVGTWYPNDSAFNPKPPVALGRFAMIEEDAQMTQGAIDLTPGASKLDAVLKSGTWSWVGWRWIARGSWKQCLWSIAGNGGALLELLAPGEGDGYSSSFELQLEQGSQSASGRSSTELTEKWRQLAVTVTGGTATFYVDGTAIGSGAVPAWTQTVTGGFIGSDKPGGGGDNRFLGAATQDAWLSKGLSAADVKALYDEANKSLDYLPIYGIDSSSYGGNKAWFTRSREAVLSGDRPLVFTWWGSVPKSMSSAQIAAEVASATGGEHANGWTPIADNTAANYITIPDYEGVVPEVNTREHQTRLASGQSWSTPAQMYPDAAEAYKAPLWTVSDEWDMGDLLSAEAGTWADKAAKYNADLDKYLPDDLRTYTNQGTGATMLQRKRWYEREFFKHPKNAMTSIDFYTGCISALTAQAAKRGGWPTDDHATLRRPASYAHVVERNRNFPSFAMPVLCAIGLGHANQPNASADWQGVPTPNMVEASAFASLIGGAQGVLWFPQSFKEPTRDGATPQWNAQTAYKFGDQVRADKDGLETYWFCHRDSPAGVDPRTDAPNVRWVRWRPDGGSNASNPTSHAIGMPDAVQRTYRVFTAESKAIQARRSPWNAGAGLIATVIENVGGKSHAIVMQDMWHESGTYTVKLPASAAGQTVTVAHQIGTDAAATRTATAGATFAETFTDSAQAFWYSWDSGPQMVALGLVAHIGDSLSTDQSNMPPDAATFIGARYQAQGFSGISWDGSWGRYINTGAPGDPRSTTQIIRDIRAKGAEPSVWVIALGQNALTTWTDYTTDPLNLPDFTGVDEVLAELGPQARVVWVGVYAPDSQNSVQDAMNAGIRSRVDARGHLGTFADWKAYLLGGSFDLNRTGALFRDGTHMTQAGYTVKCDWLAPIVKAAATK